jgi:hypothetical protein
MNFKRQVAKDWIVVCTEKELFAYYSTKPAVFTKSGAAIKEFLENGISSKLLAFLHFSSRDFIQNEKKPIRFTNELSEIDSQGNSKFAYQNLLIGNGIVVNSHCLHTLNCICEQNLYAYCIEDHKHLVYPMKEWGQDVNTPFTFKKATYSLLDRRELWINNPADFEILSTQIPNLKIEFYSESVDFMKPKGGFSGCDVERHYVKVL